MISAADYHQLGMELCNQGNYLDADRLASEGLARFPGDGALWQIHGLARWMMGDGDRAREALEWAAVFDRLVPLARCALADCYVEAGRVAEAREIFLDLARAEDTPTRVLRLTASGLSALQENGAALDVCRKIIACEPGDADAHFGVAYFLGRLGSSRESLLPALSSAYHLAPENLHYRMSLASVLVELGRADEAYPLLLPVAPESVTCPCCLRRMLQVFTVAGDPARTRACCGRLQSLAEAGAASEQPR